MMTIPGNMSLEELLRDKTLKAKEKVKIMGEWLVREELAMEDLLALAGQQKAAAKATCLEAVEWATKINPGLANDDWRRFVTSALKEDEPRIKWESAKVISNIAPLFPDRWKEAVEILLVNAGHPGTVVRWASACALGEIVKLKQKHNTILIPKIKKLLEKETDNGVRKKYLDALKQVEK